MIKIAVPVYKYTSESNPTIMIIHKSPKKPNSGIWQISYFLPGMSDQTATPLGDSEFPSLTHALLYAKKMGFNLAEKAGDEARVAALFGISVSKGIVNNYWDEYLCSQDSHCSHKKAETKKQAAPVYKLESEVIEDIYLIIHKSVQNPGWWQVTQFEKETDEPINDKQCKTLQEAMGYAAEGEFEIVQKSGIQAQALSEPYYVGEWWDNKTKQTGTISGSWSSFAQQLMDLAKVHDFVIDVLFEDGQTRRLSAQEGKVYDSSGLGIGYLVNENGQFKFIYTYTDFEGTDEEKVEAEQEKEAVDTAGTTWVARNEPGEPTERGEITQLEHGKDTNKNRTQQR